MKTTFFGLLISLTISAINADYVMLKINRAQICSRFASLNKGLSGSAEFRDYIFSGQDKLDYADNQEPKDMDIAYDDSKYDETPYKGKGDDEFHMPPPSKYLKKAREMDDESMPPPSKYLKNEKAIERPDDESMPPPSKYLKKNRGPNDFESMTPPNEYLKKSLDNDQVVERKTKKKSLRQGSKKYFDQRMTDLEHEQDDNDADMIPMYHHSDKRPDDDDDIKYEKKTLNDELALPPPDEYLKKRKFIDAEAVPPPSIFRDEKIYDEFSMTPPNVFLKKSKRVESDEFIPQIIEDDKNEISMTPPSEFLKKSLRHVPLDLGDDIKDERLRDLYKEKEENDAELISLNLHSHKDEHEDNDHGVHWPL